MNTRLWALGLGFLALICVPQYANAQAEGTQDATVEDAPAKEMSKEELAKAQASALNDQVKRTMSNLEIDEVTHFGVMYTNYMIYSTVKAVHEDVGNAVAKCAENNKDMAGTLQARYDGWSKNVGEVMAEANSNINNLAMAQTYMSQQEVNTLFGLVDETRRVNSSRFETTPLTTPEACEFMLSKMDETEESLGHMLQATLISYPTLLKKNQK